MRQFNIAINGQKAVDAAYKFIGGGCYRGIYNHGKRIGQMEVVIDEDGYYNGYPNKWVDVTVPEQKQIENTESKQSNSKIKINILGATPLDFSVNSTLDSIKEFLSKHFEIISTFAMGSSIEDIQKHITNCQ